MAAEVEPGFRPIKTKEDVRLLFHTLALVLGPVFIIGGFTTETGWTYWTGLVLAFIDALLSLVLTPDGLRKVLYALSALVVAILGVLNLGDPAFTSALAAAIVGAISSVIAVFYTPASVATQLPPRAGVVQD